MDTLLIAPIDLDVGDPALDEVFAALEAMPELSQRLGKALRQSLDEVIDGPRTGRFRVEQLEKTEKTYIGTKVEIVVRAEFEFPRGAVLDNLLCGHEVDTKFSLSGNWMIPREAVGELCLLLCANDNRGTFSAGMLRMVAPVLTLRGNQDGKRSVSAAGRAHIRWLIKDGPLPTNFLLRLDEATREALLSPKSGKQRILALFRNVIGQVIPRSAIVHVAQLKGDPLRRAREAKDTLAREGLRVLCAAYQHERAEFLARGFEDPADDDWLVVPV